MRAVLAAALCLVGACYDDAPGVRLVINDPGLGAVRVELFLATRTCPEDECDRRIAPDRATDANTARRRLAGEVFFLDGPAMGVTPKTTLELANGRAVFELRAQEPGVDTNVKRLYVVAFDGQGVAVAAARMSDVTIPADDTVAYVVDLGAVTQAPSSETPTPEGARVWLWRQGDVSSAACLGVEAANGRDAVEREWLVPEDDPDCDDIADDAECDPYFWRKGPDTDGLDGTDASCIVPIFGGGGCRLGAENCADGQTPGLCAALQNPAYCLADAICRGPTCEDDLAECQALGRTTAIVCHVPLTEDGAACDNSTPGRAPLHLDLANYLACTNVQFTPFDVTQGVHPSMTYSPATAPNAVFTLGAVNPAACKLDIDFTGFVNLMQPSGFTTALDVTAPQNHIILPIRFEVDRSECANEPTCSVIAPTVAGELLTGC